MIDIHKERKKLELTQKELASKLGVSYQTIQNWEKGTVIPKSKIQNIEEFFKNKGEMFNDGTKAKVINLEPEQEPTGYYYPDVLASAGLETEMQNDELNKIPINIPNWGKDLSFINVYGDSMYPKYCAGEIIGIKEIEANMLHFGLAYVVIMDNGEVYLKYITAGKNDEHFTLSSENPKNPPREYHLSLIKKIYIVKGVLTKTTM